MPRKSPYLWVWGLLLALGATLATFAFVRKAEESRTESDFQTSAVERIDLLVANVDLALGQLGALGAYYDASAAVDRESFRRLTQPMLRMGSTIQALEWVPRVLESQRALYLRAARRDGLSNYAVLERTPDGHMAPAGMRPEYYPVFYIEPLAGNERALGFDLSSNPARRAALEQAAQSGELRASGRITLVQENSDQSAFLAFRPVYRAGVVPADPADRSAAIRGFVLGVFRIGDIVASAGKGADSRVWLAWIDADAVPGQQLLYPQLPGYEGFESLPKGYREARSVSVAGRNWVIVALPGPGAFEVNRTASLSILLLGLLASLLASAYLRQLRARQAQVEEKIHERTADLNQERNFSNAVFGSAGTINLVIDRDGRVVRFNKAAEAFTGYSFEQVCAEAFFWERFLPEEERANARAAFAYFQEGGVPKRLQYHWRNHAGDQRLFDWTTSALPDQTGAPRYLIAIGVDITAQARLEEESRQQQLWLRTILDNLGEGVYTLDGNGKLSYLNAQAEQMLGWTFGELAGKGVHNIIHHHRPDGTRLIPEECPIYLAMHANQVYRSSEELFFRRDDTPLPVKVSGAPLQIQGRHMGSVVMFSDISAEVLLQQRLVQAKEAAEAAARMKSEFLSTMSHEIRTPLNGVIGMTELLLDTPLNEEQQEFLRVIRESADALKFTIDEILDFSKIEAGKLVLEQTDFSLRQVVEGSVDILGAKARDKGISLASFVAPEIPEPLIGDAGRIRQVLLNFLSNAIKFSDQGLVYVSAIADGPADAQRAWILLRVRDSGIGISAEAQARLFAPFTQADSSTTRKYGGTGLGLAICKRLVEAMGGTIGVDSELGHGAAFWARLPLQRSEHEQEPPVVSLEGRTVLAAGSNVDAQNIWRSYCENWHVRCRVSDGLAGVLSQLRTLESKGSAPDWLLLAQPLSDAPIEEAVAALKDRGIPTVCCLPQLDRQLQERLQALGSTVISEPIKQSALFDALSGKGCIVTGPTRPVEAPARAPAVVLDSAGAIDLARIVELFDDDREAICDLLSVFGESMRAIGERVSQQASGPPAPWKDLAHEIKGMAANIGATSLAALAAQIETAAAQGDAATVWASVPALEREIGRAIDSAERYAKESQDAASAGHR